MDASSMSGVKQGSNVGVLLLFAGRLVVAPRPALSLILHFDTLATTPQLTCNRANEQKVEWKQISCNLKKANKIDY